MGMFTKQTEKMSKVELSGGFFDHTFKLGFRGISACLDGVERRSRLNQAQGEGFLVMMPDINKGRMDNPG